MFPYLLSDQNFTFPDPIDGQDVVAVGGNLSPGMLLSAYRVGVFPWFQSDDEPIMWYSLDPRMVLYPSRFHLSRSLQKLIRKQPWRCVFDHDFAGTVRQCAMAPRDGQVGTWITPAMQQAYIQLHELGYAHSCEVYDHDDNFIGGFYGVNLGSIFFGESMVSLQPNASKYALAHFMATFVPRGLQLVDCQMATSHMASLGAHVIPRAEFVEILQNCVHQQLWRGSWYDY